ncbi:glycosyltransferase [Candidatus Parcubacteria bacterium]|nr:MAG: glycosyltransferase [Candidatus Parcubacteria bacterium]
MISIIFPAYNEEDNVNLLHARIKEAMVSVGMEYEIIAVDNGSTDGTLRKLKELSPIKIIEIAKNINQTTGIDAGIKNAEGDIIILIDGDRQNDPADIPKLLNKLNEGFDIVSGWRLKREDIWLRRFVSLLANWITYKMTGLRLHDYGCALKAYRKDILNNISLYGETHAFLPAILFMKGAMVAEIPVNHFPRINGKSKVKFSGLFKNIGDLLSVVFLQKHMRRPLVFFGTWGITSIFLGIIAAIAAIALKILQVRNLAQTPLPVIASLFFIMGFIFFMWGFLGEMMAKIYFEGKDRTPYLIRRITKISSS